eukprot:11533562-Ditylum_brightwellii.AAC.1
MSFLVCLLWVTIKGKWEAGGSATPQCKGVIFYSTPMRWGNCVVEMGLSSCLSHLCCISTNMCPIMHLNLYPNVVVMKKDKEGKLEALQSIYLVLWGLVVKWGSCMLLLFILFAFEGEAQAFVIPFSIQDAKQRSRVKRGELLRLKCKTY